MLLIQQYKKRKLNNKVSPLQRASEGSDFGRENHSSNYTTLQ